MFVHLDLTMGEFQELNVSIAKDTRYDTKILRINPENIGRFIFHNPEKKFLENWEIELSKTSSDAQNLAKAAAQLKVSNIPVAFPTETVYGLGADATRSSAVLGIYQAKQRPSDNPLIVHISSLTQLRRLLLPQIDGVSSTPVDVSHDPIPAIYHSLISRFWPGPLTIILPLPSPSPFASSVTASLSTFGARMPSSLLALALIHLAATPIAAPSANTSTKPSTTTAAHVMEDLSGRIEYIVDGGPSIVGIESTVVDGLRQPPVILRPGGVSIDQIRGCLGWENVTVEYVNDVQDITPRAPGMKYRHYTPKAKVILVNGVLTKYLAKKNLNQKAIVGVIRTKRWKNEDLERNLMAKDVQSFYTTSHQFGATDLNSRELNTNNDVNDVAAPTKFLPIKHLQTCFEKETYTSFNDIWTIGLGQDTAGIARGLFSALRELDRIGVDIIFVEAIGDTEGDMAAAVMNRLRKAAELELES